MNSDDDDIAGLCVCHAVDALGAALFGRLDRWLSSTRRMASIRPCR